MTQPKTYLGDGVYALDEGFQILLTAENGIETTNTIAMDYSVLRALDAYRERIKAANLAERDVELRNEAFNRAWDPKETGGADVK